MDNPTRWVNLDEVLKILDDPHYDLTISIDSNDHDSVQEAADKICYAVCDNIRERLMALEPTIK